MSQINCYIPIKLRLVGRLSDDQLERLAGDIGRSVAERLAAAEAVIASAHSTLERVGTVELREAFDPARLSRSRYNLPSYDNGGKAVGVPVAGAEQDRLEEDFETESAQAAELMEKGETVDDRAFATRLLLLLNQLRPHEFLGDDGLDEFIEDCRKQAATEAATIKALIKVLPNLLDDHGEGFPKTWADKILKDFNSRKHADLEDLDLAWKALRKDALEIAARVPAGVWEHGLPLNLDEARRVDDADILRLVLNMPVRGPAIEPTYGYGRALYYWRQALYHYSFVKEYQTHLELAAWYLRRGEAVGSGTLYKSLRKQYEDFYRDLQQLKGGALHVQGYHGYKWIRFGDPEGFYPVPAEGIEVFKNQIKVADQRIAATDINDCLIRAFIWAFSRDYIDESGQVVWNAIKEHGWEIVIKAAAIFAVQYVPGLNIAVDIVLAIEFGFDVISTIADLAGALKDASSAKSVIQMQRSAGNLALALVGLGAKVLLWAIGWSAGKFAGEVAKYRRGKKFIDEHGDTPDVRKALGDARGDIATAERNLVAERERIAAEQQRLAAAQQQKVVPPAKIVDASKRDPTPSNQPLRVSGGRKQVTLEDIFAWEGKGGHALANHGPQHTRRTLLDRIVGEREIPAPRDLPGGGRTTDFRVWKGERSAAASRWTDHETMVSTIGEVLNNNLDEIVRVTRNGGEVVLEHISVRKPVGEGWVTTSSLPGHPVPSGQRGVFWRSDLRNVTMVIRPDARGGWYLHTAYPD